MLLEAHRRLNSSFSIIIPAYNEEKYLPDTLRAVNKATALFTKESGRFVQLLVIDNQSDDKTAFVAREHGATVVPEATHNISRVRNRGATAASGDILVFVDADTIVPELLVLRICRALSDPKSIGGAFDTHYRPQSRLLRWYLFAWRVFGQCFRMAQGSTQFVRRDIFESVGRYNEELFMGEDVDFYWRLQKFAKRHGLYAQFIRDLRVNPSSRRFDTWPLWKTLLWTNPLWITFFKARSTMWDGWYSRPVR